jgi:ADP-ribosylglycohydrolase
MLDCVLDYTPSGATRDGISRAADLPRLESVEIAVNELGNGTRVTAPDTVPLCLWLAARHFENYPAAMWQTVSAGGDIDTNCAIVGGIIALAATGDQGIPAPWLRSREPLNLDLGTSH